MKGSGEKAEPKPAEASSAARVTAAMVLLSLIGGAVCAFALCLGSSTYEEAVAHSPLFLAWGLLLVTEGVVSWAGLLPAGWVLSGFWKKAAKGTRWLLVGALVLVLVALFGYFFAIPQAFPLKVTWPLGADHGLRILVITLVVLIPTCVAILTMWFAAAAADTTAGEVKTEHIAAYLDCRSIVQSCLWFVGVVIGTVVLATGMLRQSMLAGPYAKEAQYPAALVLAYGGFFTLILAACYAPAYGVVRRSGVALQQKVLKGATDIHAWNEERKKVGDLLGLDLRIDQTLKDSIAILAPLVASLASTALPGLAK